MSSSKIDELGLRFNAQGLVAAVVQDAHDRRVLMLAWMNREALEKTLAGPLVTFYSRSRQMLWTKGETSGNVLEVVSVQVDCDGDTLLVRARPAGPVCHTGTPTCFEEPFVGVLEEGADLGEQLARLLGLVEERRSSPSAQSYTSSLLAGGARAIGAKLEEEALELANALGTETTERVVSEAADLLYHLMVGLGSRGVSGRTVAVELARREGISGLEEKRSRGVATRERSDKD